MECISSWGALLRLKITLDVWGHIPDALAHACAVQPLYSTEYPAVAEMIETADLCLASKIVSRLLQRAQAFGNPPDFPVCLLAPCATFASALMMALLASIWCLNQTGS